jgi:hypothetical protein
VHPVLVIRDPQTYDHTSASVLLLLVTFAAVVTAVTLGTDTDDVSLLDVGDLGADSNGDTADLVSDDLGVVGSSPSGRSGVQVGSALIRLNRTRVRLRVEWSERLNFDYSQHRST